jgi:phosphopantetheinyl transferase (holo-ACP synthase)
MSPEVAVRWSEIGVRGYAADEAVLDDRERRRAATIRHPDARVRFVTAHATLRRLLAELLDADPTTFRITADRRGRPGGISGWSISLAHTHDAVVVAAGREVEVGVDIERLDRERVPPVERWCTSAEVSACRVRGAGARGLTMRLWTGKEALAKAAGIGMRMPFREWEVLRTSVGDPRPWADPTAPATGTVRWLDLSTPHAIALATLPVLPRTGQRRLLRVGPAGLEPATNGL